MRAFPYPLAIALSLMASGSVQTQPASITSSDDCSPLPARVAALIEGGWMEYRANDMPAASRSFSAALVSCPRYAGANAGAGYVALRRGDLAAARQFFAAALVRSPRDYDALTGSGIATYRAGQPTASRVYFERALEVVPGDSMSLWHLARLPVAVPDVELPPVQRPAVTQLHARVGKRVLEVPDGRGGWKPLWIKGLNVGAALPGRFPSQFPADDGTYEGWIELAADMGVNVLRVYTIHPPHFYRALAEWNNAHPSAPIWIIHGVWTELPPGKQRERYEDAKWRGEFRAEMRRVVDLLHGNLILPHRPGHASGVYTANVAPWVLAYIIGREWEPFSIAAYSAKRRRSDHSGKYLAVRGGNAADVWLAEECDYLVDYEMNVYNAQRPIAYTNWPTLDPLRHATESTLDEEKALLSKRGERLPEPSREYDNDIIGLDATKVAATPAFAAGTFASYHAYPYYPDFMIHDPGYLVARSPEGPSAYYGYLRELVEYHGDMPVVISEYGVPSSRGIAHFQPQGWHHGGHSEASQANVNARLTRDIHASGAAGAVLFATIDEWFKKNWVVIDFSKPAERKPLWLNVLDAEQHYGLVAMRAGHRDSAIVIDGDGADWKERGELYAGGEPASLPYPLRLRSLRVTSDEAFVYLRLDVGAIDWSRGRYLIGIDSYRAELGGTRLPYTGTTSPVGLEFVLDLNGPDGSHLLVDRPYNLYTAKPIAGSRPRTTMNVWNRPFRTVANSAGQWESTLVETNRRRLGRDGKLFPAITYNRSRLLFARQAGNSLADWYADTAHGVIEVRIGWGMLHVLDPSSRNVLYGVSPLARDPEATITDGFRFVVQSYDPRNPRVRGDLLPRGTGTAFAPPPTWTWPVWEQPTWHAEIKPLFHAMRDTFNGIEN